MDRTHSLPAIPRVHGNGTVIGNRPVAVDDLASVNQDSFVVVNLVSNDSDADLHAFSVISVSQGTNGSTVNNGDGTATYTPNPGFSGADSFRYTIQDVDGNIAGARVDVTINPVGGIQAALFGAFGFNTTTFG